MEQPKIIARYLPQFHRIPENDKWWGRGFTEWTAVKGAKSLFPKHCQPQEPLNDNYYNLLDKSTMMWQATLAKKYGVDGFAFYHYWFECGKMVLEKPAENLLMWQDIDMPFCFCWANQTWARTWSKFAGANSWNSICETQDIEKDVLLRQRYRLIDEWKKHIDYLIPFFKDKRYLKYNGRPIFIILQPEDEELCMCMNDMIGFWNKRLEHHGLNTLYLIAEKRSMISLNMNIYDKELLRFPDVLFSQVTINEINGTQTFDYEEYVRKMVSISISAMERGDIVCVADAWDNTPRYGKDGSVILQKGETLFAKWWKRVVRAAVKQNVPFMFYNAWNEWGEGMFLEPSVEKSFFYLENILDVKKNMTYVSLIDQDVLGIHYDFPLKEREHKVPRGLLEKWMNLRDENARIGDYLERNNIHRVAIYGIGMFGRHLTRELLNSSVEVVCLMDKNHDIESFNLPLYNLESQCPKVDLIIVTPFGFAEEISRELNRKYPYPTCSLEYIINDMLLELQMRGE